MRSRFPNYAWEHHTDNIDKEIKICTPETNDPNTFGKVILRNLQEPVRKDKMGNTITGRIYKIFIYRQHGGNL